MVMSDPIDRAFVEAQQKKFKEVLDGLCLEYGVNEIISGGARGADTLARDYAKSAAIEFTEFPVTSYDWGKYGKAAGALRNIKMLREGEPDLVVAFPGGRGTAHMVSISKAANVKVIEIER
jgi:hypothetical protein